jgi:hypothetical protein
VKTNHATNHRKVNNKNPEPRDESSQSSQPETKNKKKEEKMKEQEKQEFRPRSMKKHDLAHMYMPDIKRESAVRQLNRWITTCTELSRELRATDYNPFSKTLTALQVRLIVEYLGEP